MVYAYEEKYLTTIAEIVGDIFRKVAGIEDFEIDRFAQKFAKSEVAHAIEYGDLEYLMSEEIEDDIASLICRELSMEDCKDINSREYWVGYILVFIQRAVRRSFKEIFALYLCSRLLKDYDTYGDMDPIEMVKKIKQYISMGNKLKQFREKKKMTQQELSNNSNVTVKNIKAYEDGTVDISKAQGDTLFRLSRALGCTIEELLI